MKGQTAIEYLMTYGWAILIILIVAGVLAYYGIFAPAGFLGPSAKGFAQVAVLSPWSVDILGNLTLQLENRVGQDITLSNVFATTGTGGADDVCTGALPSGTIAAGTRTLFFTVACTGAVGGTSGSTYSISVAIEYSVGATYFNSTGTLSGTRS